MTELKPCPFCGSTDLSNGWCIHYHVPGAPYCYWQVGCGCGATVMVRVRGDDYDECDLPTIKEGVKIATDRWNKRVIL